MVVVVDMVVEIVILVVEVVDMDVVVEEIIRVVEVDVVVVVVSRSEKENYFIT